MYEEHLPHERFASPRQRRRRRHRHGRSFGRMGHRARRGDVRAAVLALLSERDMHGYEMIKELEERTGGLWSPSAGSIYPTLQLLEDEGLIEGTEGEGKRRFTLTDEGRAAAQERTGDTPWEEVTAGAPVAQIHLRRAAGQLRGAFAQVAREGDDEQAARTAEVLDDARKRIYEILAEDSGTSK